MMVNRLLADFAVRGGVIRWRKGDRSMTTVQAVSDLELTESAFRNGALDRELLRRACRNASQWLEHGPRGTDEERARLKAALDRAEALLPNR
jgi:hypothetical protein